MPLPPVVIELSTADAASPNAPALVRACSEAVSGGECRIGATAEPDARAVVIVSWDADRRQARIEIGVRSDGKNRWVSRQLSFRDADPEPERWRTVGLVVGTLVGETEREAQQNTATPPDPKPAPPPAPSPNELPRRPAAQPGLERGPARLWLGVDGVAGPALDDGSWRIGAAALALYDVPQSRVLGVATARYLARPADEQEVDARWFGLSLGLGLHHEPTPELRFEGRAELALERMTTSVGGARRDSEGRWYPGFRLVLGAGAHLGDWGALVATGELAGSSQGTVITLENEVIGRAPPLTWALTLGARLRLF